MLAGRRETALAPPAGMKLYCTPNSTFSRRVRIALVEKGIAADEISTDAKARDTDEYREINPYGRIPALVDGDLVLYESTAILEYLDAKHPEPPLVPREPAGRALAAMHVKLCDLEFAPHALRIQRPMRFEPKDTWDLEGMGIARRAIERHYAILERELQGRDFLVGNRFGLPEIAYLPFLHFHSLLDVDLPPNIAGWWKRMESRKSAQATIPSA